MVHQHEFLVLLPPLSSKSRGMHLLPRQASQSNIARPAAMKEGQSDSTEAGLAMMLISCLWLSTFLTLPQPGAPAP